MYLATGLGNQQWGLDTSNRIRYLAIGVRTRATGFLEIRIRCPATGEGKGTLIGRDWGSGGDFGGGGGDLARG